MLNQNQSSAKDRAVLNFHKVIHFLYSRNQENALSLHPQLAHYKASVSDSDSAAVIVGYHKCVSKILVEAATKARLRGERPTVKRHQMEYFEKRIPDLVLEHLIECSQQGVLPSYDILLDRLAAYASLKNLQCLAWDVKVVETVGELFEFSAYGTRVYAELTRRLNRECPHFDLRDFVELGTGIDDAYREELHHCMAQYERAFEKYLHTIRPSELSMKGLWAGIESKEHRELNKEQELLIPLIP